MKKYLVLMLVLLVSCSILAGCGTETATMTSTQTQTTTAVQTTTSIATQTTTATATSTQQTTATSTKPSTTTTTATGGPKYGGVLKVFVPAVVGSPAGWPVESRGGIPGYSVSPALEGLIDRDMAGNLSPWLATAWEVTSDKKAIILTLRQGVKFHDGSDLNADAVKFNLDAYLTAKNVVATTWDSIDVVDNYTVKINLKYFANTMPSDLTNIRIISKTAYETKGLDYVRWTAVGTGPFVHVSFERDVKSTFEKFDDYWQEGKPYLDGVEMIFVVDKMTQALGFQAGEANILASASGKTAADLRDLGYEVIVKGTPGVRSLLFDSANSDSPFSDIRVRQAVNFAINRDAIVKALGRGFWFPMYQIVDPVANAYLPELDNRYSYNPDKAKALLAEAGFSGGFDTKLTPTADPEGLDSMVSVQSYLGAVGINVDVQYVDYPRFNQIRFSEEGWHGMLMDMPTPIGGNFAAFIRSYYYNGTPPGYISTERPEGFYEIIDEALLTIDPATKKELDQQLHQLMADEVMLAPMYGVTFQFPIQGVKGADILYSGFYTGWHPANAWLDE